MKVAYIAGKYTAPTIRGVVENIRLAEAAAIRYWNAGYAVICPHMNSALLDGAVDYETFMAGDFEFLSRADVVVMLSNWRNSPGATRERALAKELGKEIIYEDSSDSDAAIQANHEGAPPLGFA